MMLIKLKEHTKSCSTREKGRNFYEYLKSLNSKEFEFDFTDINHVSTSFLDESIWKIAAEGIKVLIRDPDSLLEEKIYLVEQWRPKPVQIFKQNSYLHLEPSLAL